MRIIADIPHPRMKITVFQMNGKISIKFEKHLIEHILKLRDGSPLNELDKLKSSLTSEVLIHMEKAIENQHVLRSEIELKLAEDDLEEFDEII